MTKQELQDSIKSIKQMKTLGIDIKKDDLHNKLNQKYDYPSFNLPPEDQGSK